MANGRICGFCGEGGCGNDLELFSHKGKRYVPICNNCVKLIENMTVCHCIGCNRLWLEKKFCRLNETVNYANCDKCRPIAA